MNTLERFVNSIITFVMVAGAIYFLAHILIAWLDGRFEVIR
jgi:hypothetical protein